MSAINVGDILAGQVDDAERSGKDARHDVAEFVHNSGLLEQQTGRIDQEGLSKAWELAQLLAQVRATEQFGDGLNN